MKTLETDVEIRADGSVKLLSPLPPWLKPGRAHVLMTVKSLEEKKEAPRHKITSPDITDDYSKLRKKIQKFQNLSSGWDSYEAEAPSRDAISAALSLVENLQLVDVLPEWVTPTSDSTILMRYRHQDVWYDWEFHNDGDVAVMRKPLYEKETYHDFKATEVDSFFKNQYSTR